MISNTPPTNKRPADTDLESSPRSGVVSRLFGGFFSSSKKRRKIGTSETDAVEASKSFAAQRKDFDAGATLPVGVSTVSSPNAEQTEQFSDALSHPSAPPVTGSDRISKIKENSGLHQPSEGSNSVLRSGRPGSRLTQSSFRKARFSSETKFHTRQGSHTSKSTIIKSPGGNAESVSGVYYKGTPYRRHKVQIQSYGTTANTIPSADASTVATTPGSFQSRKKYRTTPYVSKSANEASRTSRTFQKRYKPASSTLLSAATPKRYQAKSKLRIGSTPKLALADSQKDAIIKQLTKQNSAINSLRSPSGSLSSGKNYKDGGLFRDPALMSTGSKIQSVGMRRVYGNNQDGSRLLLGNDATNSPSKGDAIRSRRESSKRGAFTGKVRGGNDYWNDTAVHGDSQEQLNGGTQNKHMIVGQQNDMFTGVLNEGYDSDNDDNVQAIKRKKVSFNRTPPDQKTSSLSDKFKGNSTPVDVMPARKTSTPSKLPPIRTEYVKRHRSTNGEGYGIRNGDGTIEYPSEVVYGTTLDYGTLFMDCYTGKEVSDITDIVMKTKASKMKYPFNATAIGPGNTEGTESLKRGSSNASLPVPFNSIPKQNISSRKGNSSILNKLEKALGSSAKESQEEKAPKSQPELSSNGWGNMFAMKPGQWKCDACFVTNPATATKCLACESDKPGASDSMGTSSDLAKNTNTTNGTGAPEPVSKDPPKFTFGAPTSTSVSKDIAASTADGQSKFSFGAPASVSKDATESVTSSVPKFSFGAPSKDASGSVTSGAPKFSFGVPDSTSEKPTTSAASISFSGSKMQASTEEMSASKPAEGGFTFGAATSPKSKNSDNDVKDTSSKPKISFGEDPKKTAEESSASSGQNTKSMSSFTFGVTAPTESKENTEKPSFQFGSIGKAPEIQKPAVAFGSIPPTAKTDPVLPVPLTDIGPSSKKKRSIDSDDAAPKATEAPKLSFGSSSTSAPPTSTAPKFSFGANKDSEGGSKPAFSFGSGKTSSASSSTTFTFGASSSTPAPAKSAQPSTTVPASKSGAPPFTFGSSSSTETSGVAPTVMSSGAKFTFGSSALTPTDSAPVTAATKAPGISFGSIPSDPAPAAGGFSFGQQPSTTVVAPTQPVPNGSNFAFGAAPAPSVPTTGGASFTFGATNNPPSTTTFGTSSVPPIAPAFGAQAAAPATPAFGFGQQTPAPVPTPAPAFGFGGATPAAQATQFGAPAPVAPSFGGSAAPIGGGMGGGFNIGTSGASKTNRGGRRIIRARRPPSSNK